MWTSTEDKVMIRLTLQTMKNEEKICTPNSLPATKISPDLANVRRSG